MVEDFEARQQREFLLTLSRVAGLVAGGLAVGYQLGLQFSRGALAFAVFAVAALLLPRIAARWSIRAAGHAVAVLVLSAVGFICSQRDDMPLGALVYLCVVPVATSYLAGPRAALGWTVSATLLTALAVWRVKSGYATAAAPLITPDALAQRDVFEASSVVGVLAMMTGMALSIERRRTRVERERLRLKDELDQRVAIARVGRLAAGVAHEINNPLAWMTSGLSFLKARVAELPAGSNREEFEEVLGELHEGTRRVGVIVGDLQAVARSESDDTGVADLARVLRIVKSLGRELRITAPDALPQVKANEGTLAELLLELVVESGGSNVELTVARDHEALTCALTPLLDPPLHRVQGLLSSWGGTATVNASGLELRLRLA